jgi:Uma2 family endonuclease
LAPTPVDDSNPFSIEPAAFTPQRSDEENAMNRLLVLDEDISEDLIRERRRLGNDRYDEVWDGVYVMPPLASNFHQDLVGDLYAMTREVVYLEGRGRVQPGANVSDRNEDWKENFRVPDVVVVLNDGTAIDRGTHWQGGPDFLVEVESPGDDTEEKLPFYSQIRVREVLIIHRDSRKLKLLRLNDGEFTEVEPAKLAGRSWLCSEVVRLAFRRVRVRGRPRTVVCRTDGQAGEWTV